MQRANLNMKILVVDDFLTIRRAMRDLLLQLGFTDVEEAADGEEAYRKLRDGDFDLCLSDWNMRPVNGLELLQLIRADQNIQELPFIMVSTESREERIQQVMDAGADGFIVKPCSLSVLRQRMEEIMGPLPDAA